ncbi:MAG: hypothetical protein H8E36_06345 [Rhodospirillaceae bacterium]|nr:hypothetical protein [Rhodospirillaceae bacterium]MBL6929985.1 hypothetical protein [Rhodospirillales bacterium]MBL6942451.1 hypothetical protein [Rhodospirillales bacterium]
MFKRKSGFLCFPKGLLLGAGLVGLVMATSAHADHATFKAEVMPILKEHCLECHVPGQEGFDKSGLDMRTYESLMKGTEYGPIIVPGDAFSSNMMVLIEGRADAMLKMPHGGRKDLTKWEKLMLRRWINRGALNN